MGFNKDNVIVIANSNRLGTGEETFRQQLASMRGIKSASITNSIPTKNLLTDGYIPVESSNEHAVKGIQLSSFVVDYDFVPTLQLQVKQGRNFSRDFFRCLYSNT